MTPGSKCNVVPRQVLRNITLENVWIYNPQMATGVILGSPANPIENVVMDNVRVTTMGLPPAITRRPLSETFPGTKQPIHDPYVPPAYANKFQRQVVGLYGWIVNLIVTIGRFVTRVVERIHLALILRLLQTQDGAQAWYFAYLGQALLNTVWVWIVLAIGFAVAGTFSFRGWKRYCRRLKERRQSQQQQEPQQGDDGNDADEDEQHPLFESGNRISNDDEDIIVNSDESNNPTDTENRISGDDAQENQTDEQELLLNRPRVETRWPRFLCHMGYMTLLCICWGGALYTGTFPFRKPKWERTYRYFACESVVNGVARGNTWPVPSCFKNERPPWWHGGGNDDDDNDASNNPEPPHHHRRHRHGSDHWSPHKVELHMERFVLTALVGLVVLGFALWKHWTEERQRRRVDGQDRADSAMPVPSFVTVDASQGEEEERLWSAHETLPESSDEERYVDPLADFSDVPN